MLTIKVLGTGCPNCQKVEANVKEAVTMFRPDGGYALIKVTDPVEIGEYVLRTPGLMINDTVVCEGRIPHASEIMTWMANALENA